MWGFTNRDGAARKAPHANTRTPGTLAVASHKRSKRQYIVGKGTADVLKRDVTWRKEPALPEYPEDICNRARAMGMSPALFVKLAKLTSDHS